MDPPLSASPQLQAIKARLAVMGLSIRDAAQFFKMLVGGRRGAGWTPPRVLAQGRLGGGGGRSAVREPRSERLVPPTGSGHSEDTPGGSDARQRSGIESRSGREGPNDPSPLRTQGSERLVSCG